MDGYEFQEFVASLFKKLGFVRVKVGPPAADGGIDISMEQRTDIGSISFIAECKHHPKSTIGRPVVQKLHSAVMHTPVLDKGIIVTSGRFSSQAIKYAEEVGIELIDMEKLKELAGKAGLSVQTELSLSIENCFPISEKAKIVEELISFLQSDLKGFNKDSTKVEEVGLKLLPSYLIDYFINATFSTSVGIIHSVTETSAMFFSGSSGKPLVMTITQPLLPLRDDISELNQGDLKGIKILEKEEFAKNYKEIKEMAKQVLRQVYTKTVSYYGANNRRYTKTCTPRKKEITLIDVARVYLPILSFRCSVLENRYSVVGIEALHELNVLPSSVITIPESSGTKAYPDNCMICSKDMKQDKYLCNECGIIVCDKCSSKCKACGKVICKEHTISKRRFLIFSDKYCRQCAELEGIIS